MTLVRPASRRMATLLLTLVAAPWAAVAQAPAHAWWEGFYVRAGGLRLVPQTRSGPVILSNVSGTASLAVSDGPIAGSGVSVGPVTLAAVTVGYRIIDQLSVETILSTPFTIPLVATGTLATQSIAPYALGNIPTGVPPLGPQLGNAKVIPPVVTFVYRFLPESPVRPYLGAGASYLYAYDARITNPVLTSVAPPRVDLPGHFGWVVQAGGEVRLWRQLYLTLDAKYIGGLTLTATMHDLQVAVPALPLYGTARVGDASVTVAVNPWIFDVGAGWNF